MRTVCKKGYINDRVGIRWREAAEQRQIVRFILNGMVLKAEIKKKMTHINYNTNIIICKILCPRTKIELLSSYNNDVIMLLY